MFVTEAITGNVKHDFFFKTVLVRLLRILTDVHRSSFHCKGVAPATLRKPHLLCYMRKWAGIFFPLGCNTFLVLVPWTRQVRVAVRHKSETKVGAPQQTSLQRGRLRWLLLCRSESRWRWKGSMTRLIYSSGFTEKPWWRRNCLIRKKKKKKWFVLVFPLSCLLITMGSKSYS